MVTDSVGIKVMAMMTKPGHEENLVKASLCGFAKHVLMLTKIINIATSASRSM